MSFQSLQDAFQLPLPVKQKTDATKQLYEQGANFAKEMAGERGLMGAIEAAHFRPIIQKYIKSKLSSADPIGSVISDAQKARQKAAGLLQRGKKVLQPEAPTVTATKEGAGGEEPFSIGEGGYFSPTRPLRGVESPTKTIKGIAQKAREADPAGEEMSEGDIAAARKSLGGIFQAHEQEMQEAHAGVQAREAEEVSKSIESTRAAKTARAAAKGAEGTGEELESAAVRARRITTKGGQELGDVIRGGRPAEEQRAVPKPEPEPASQVGTPAMEEAGERMGTRMGTDLTSGLRIPEPAGPRPQPQARAEPDIAEQPRAETPEVEGKLMPDEPAPAIKPEDFPEVPRGPSEVPKTAVDEYGLPKVGPRVEPSGDEAARIAQESSDKEMAEGLAEKEAVGETAEAAVPGIGDILAVGTAIVGGISAAIRAHKEKMEAQDYTPSPQAAVGLVSSQTWDSALH